MIEVKNQLYKVRKKLEILYTQQYIYRQLYGINFQVQIAKTFPKKKNFKQRLVSQTHKIKYLIVPYFKGK